MLLDLRDFQETAVVDLIQEIDSARRDASDARQQAILLSSATGSGKTVILTAVMERLLAGWDGRPADPSVIFLWLSDSPELNEQSRQRIESCSDVMRASSPIKIDASFDQELFQPGKLYFLNTQKLGKDSLLVRRGDFRRWSIWETIGNTARLWPASFIVVLDEAHHCACAPATSAGSVATRVAHPVVAKARRSARSPVATDPRAVWRTVGMEYGVTATGSWGFMSVSRNEETRGDRALSSACHRASLRA